MALQLQGLRDRKTDIVVAYQYLEGSGASDLEVMPLIQEPFCTADSPNCIPIIRSNLSTLFASRIRSEY